jgi:hypothetical protein
MQPLCQDRICIVVQVVRQIFKFDFCGPSSAAGCRVSNRQAIRVNPLHRHAFVGFPVEGCYLAWWRMVGFSRFQGMSAPRNACAA